MTQKTGISYEAEEASLRRRKSSHHYQEPNAAETLTSSTGIDLSGPDAVAKFFEEAGPVHMKLPTE